MLEVVLANNNNILYIQNTENLNLFTDTSKAVFSPCCIIAI